MTNQITPGRRLNHVLPVTSCANWVMPGIPITTNSTEIGISTDPIRNGVRNAPTAANSTAPQHATATPTVLAHRSERRGSVGGGSSVTSNTCGGVYACKQIGLPAVLASAGSSGAGDE